MSKQYHTQCFDELGKLGMSRAKLIPATQACAETDLEPGAVILR